MNSKKQRDRGRILTSDGLSRLQQAIRAWELEHEVRCTQERIRELTSAVKEGGLDPGTIRKILKAKEGVDPESIRCLFTTFGLQLGEVDLVSSSRLQTQADPNFVGREGAIGDLNTLINRGAKVIVIQARGGVGKTTLARKYLQQEFGSYLEFPIAKETKDIASIESLIEEKLRQLGEEPGREFFVSLDRLKRKLQNEPIGILIDNLEPALDAAGKFIEPHRRYVELLRVLTDPTVQSVTFITTRERLREASVAVEHYMLRNLDIESWEQFFQSRNLATDTSGFAALHNAYGGNAKAMDIIRGAILEDYAGDVAAHWHANQHDLFIERDLEDLVTQQFDRLQQIDTDAYNLLCRMGCYRYQDVPAVPIEGLLCLLWDVPENKQRRIVKALQDRSLVEFENGEYWLHPVIRGEAIERLKPHPDWKIANYQAAKLWTEGIETTHSLEDTLKAFEAYHHYLEIDDYSLACESLIKERRNKWFTRLEEGETTAWSLYRLGLFQKSILAIDRIKDEIESRYSLSKLNSLMGVMYWAMGYAHRAICYHEESRKIILDFEQSSSWDLNNSSLVYKCKLIKINYFINLGLCELDLGEQEKSISFFREAVSCSESEKLTYYTSVTKGYLLFATSYNQESPLQREEMIDAVNLLFDDFVSTGWGTRGKGYVLLALGKAYQVLGEPQKSFSFYQDAIDYAKESGYIQIKIKALIGMSITYRSVGNLTEAISKNLEGIEALGSIEARYDLADAYFQLGINYQTSGKFKESYPYFQEAIRLFSDMEAPKQVARVRRSMQTHTNN